MQIDEMNVCEKERPEENEQERKDTEDKEEQEQEEISDDDDDNDTESDALVSDTLSCISHVPEIEPTSSGAFENTVILDVMAKGCGCHSWNNKPCLL